IKEKELKLKDFELREEEVDLSVEEFEEEEEFEVKYEKRKTSKEDIEAEDLGPLECPYCGEITEDIESHLEVCELAPEDATIDDVLPSRAKKKKKKKKTTRQKKKGASTKKQQQKKLECPYCGKWYARLVRHLSSCTKRPEDADEEKEKLYIEGEISLEEFKED
ncbi:MAG: hypothetical protein ACTSUN_03695, partial [Promethearchaeota archaeon]